MRVLAVDDDPADLDLFRAGLELSAIEGSVETVENRAEALAWLQANSADLIMLDVFLGKNDGFDVCKEMVDAGVTTPIVLYTGTENALDEPRAREVGAAACIYKPIDLGGMKMVIQQLTWLLKEMQPEV